MSAVSSTIEPSIFESIYETTAPRVLGLVMRVLRDRSQSEEVVQEVFLELWQAPGRIDPAKGTPLSLLLTMAHRRAIDRVRASQASRDRDLKNGIRGLEIAHDSVAEAGELTMEGLRVRKAIADLTPLQREAVTLGYYGGYDYREIATMLGVPVTTVKTRMRDGLIRLRSLMA